MTTYIIMAHRGPRSVDGEAHSILKNSPLFEDQQEAKEYAQRLSSKRVSQNVWYTAEERCKVVFCQ
jgi:hypothetical protein